jgi:hypothetical protein
MGRIWYQTDLDLDPSTATVLSATLRQLQFPFALGDRQGMPFTGML